MPAHYARVLLKLSGEALMGSVPYGIDPHVVASLAQQIRDVVQSGTQVAVVIERWKYLAGSGGQQSGHGPVNG
ncbi:MAG: hypothetical protein R2839_12215 [Thermomicrobiales bacterium]